MFNIDAIINATPEKRFINGYNLMKENYTETSAQEFSNVYRKEPLSVLLENSRMVFSEPYFGSKFYTEAMNNYAYCRFTALEKEDEKVLNFIEENGSLMEESQKNIYLDVESNLKSILEHTKNTRIYASYIKENIDDEFEDKLSTLLYEYAMSEENDESKIYNLFEAVTIPVVYFTYAPYVIEAGVSSINNLSEQFWEEASVPSEYDEAKWDTYVETVICANKLSLDSAYRNALAVNSNKNSKIIFEYFMSTSLNDKINELVEEKVSSNDAIYKSRVDAVNNIFFGAMESAMDKVIYAKEREEIDTYKAIVYENTLNIILKEYQQSDDTSVIANGYSVLTESLSLDKAFEAINDLYMNSSLYISEATDDDVSDDDIDSMGNDIEDREVGGQAPGKKPIAPKPKNLANKVQFNAMDREVKWQQKRANRKQKGQERFNAAKAVTKVPATVINDMKDNVHKLDEMDDNRRKQYMAEPGFRKKIFRNLRLAILYGGAATVKLAYIPFVALCRHFSKQKNRRIRNELVREIQTDIRVTEEKINDANAASDTAEKYRLMRIKDKLDAELARVKVNSKYV